MWFYYDASKGERVLAVVVGRVICGAQAFGIPTVSFLKSWRVALLRYHS